MTADQTILCFWAKIETCFRVLRTASPRVRISLLLYSSARCRQLLRNEGPCSTSGCKRSEGQWLWHKDEVKWNHLMMIGIPAQVEAQACGLTAAFKHPTKCISFWCRREPTVCHFAAWRLLMIESSFGRDIGIGSIRSDGYGIDSFCTLRAGEGKQW